MTLKQRIPSNGHGTRLHIGDVRVDRVVESEEPILDPLELFPAAKAADIESQISWLAPHFYSLSQKLLIVPIQGFLIRVRGKTIVVDTCVGDCKNRRRPMFHQQRRGWLQRLCALGLKPEDVDFIICTHFHADHVGWNTRLHDGRWIPSFPNARYLFTREEWEYWRSAAALRAIERTGDYMEDSVVPIVSAGLAEFVPMDYQVCAEVRLIPAAGHTPGFVCVHVASRGEHLVISGDLLHSPLQCMFPDWSTRFCVNMEKAAQTRMRLLTEWAETRTPILPTHFPSPSAGVVKRWKDVFSFHYL